MSEKQGLRGPRLLCAAVNQIIAHPETWNQSTWHCGTTHCIAGHCEILCGGETDCTFSNARDLLGLSEPDACYLFCACRTLSEIYLFASAFAAGYDRRGYNRAGYDRYGYNRAGYDRYGYNRAGERLDFVPFDLESIQ